MFIHFYRQAFKMFFVSFVLFFSKNINAQVEDPDAKYNARKDRFPNAYNPKDTFVFDDAKEFYTTNAFVKYKGKWGLLGSTGRVLFPFTFSAIKETNEAVVGVKNDTAWALFNRESMSLVSDFIFQEINYINANIITYKKGNYYGIMNISGNIICPPIYELFNTLNDRGGFGKCDKQWALIDPKGTRLTNFLYPDVKEVFANTAFVSNGTKWYLINKQGREIISQEKGFDEVQNFVSGKAIVKNNGVPIFVDTLGKFVSLKKKYLDIGPIVNNFCWVFVSKKKGWILYNVLTNQEIESKVVVEDGLPFTDEIAWAKFEDRWAMINKQGIYKTPFLFQRMIPSGMPNKVWVDVSGSAFVLLTQEGVYAFKENKMFKEIRPYKNGLAEVHDGFGWGIINQQGKIYIPCWYDNITPFNNGKGFVQLYDKWALCNKSGRLIKARVKGGEKKDAEEIAPNE